jgi:hypothetical protein
MTNTELTQPKKYTVTVKKDAYCEHPISYDDYYYILDLNTRKVLNYIAISEEKAREELAELEAKGGEYDLLLAIRYEVREIK